MKLRNKEDVKKYFEQTGNTCMELSALRKNRNMQELINARQLWTCNGMATTPYVMKVEKEIARRVIELRDAIGHFPEVSYTAVESFIKEFEAKKSLELNCVFKLAPEQEEAVHKAANSQFFVLTGGPGTGKTCVLECITFILRKMKPDARIRFTAPTGKAARRITESTGEPAKTVQKQMSLTSETAKPLPIYGDCIVVDEVSMLDTLTADAFFVAVRDGMKVILVGDIDQLPSVGYGSVLRDLIESNEIPITKLQAPQRQDSSSTLFANITNLRFGQSELYEGDDFHMITNDGNNGQATLISEYFSAVERWGIDNVCCLTPYRRKGMTCANVVNDIIQKRVNDPDNVTHITTTIIEDDGEINEATQRQVTFCLGDPVIQLVNREEIANGDIGKITDVTMDGLTVAYDGGITVSYKTEDLDQLNLAYAMSIHKSQGSEYKCVITLCLPEHERFMSRNLVYTAVTRAKKECVLIYDQATLAKGLTVEAGHMRVTLLRDFIEHEGRKAALLKALKTA